MEINNISSRIARQSSQFGSPRFMRAIQEEGDSLPSYGEQIEISSTTESFGGKNVFFNNLRSFDSDIDECGSGHCSSIHKRHRRSGVLEQLQIGVLQLPPEREDSSGSLFSLMSTLYALTLITVCIVYTCTSQITHKVSKNFFESSAFNTYIDSISIIYYLYLFCYLLRKDNNCNANNNDDDFDVSDFTKRMAKATGLNVQEIKSEPSEMLKRQRKFSIKPQSVGDVTPTLNENEDEEVLVKMMTSESATSHGSLFLRIGAIVFGLGTVIYSGMEFLTFFEIPKTCSSWSALLGANPILYMVFVFMQMYFIFNHSRVNIQRQTVLAKFGMMHLIANNVCIVIRTLVKETVKEISHSKGFNTTFYSVDCIHIDIIGNTIQNSSVYLFPFIIEYSIIGVAVIFSMWNGIGNDPVYLVDDSASAASRPRTTFRHQQALDWSSSSVGLFVGLLSLVALIITLILYFALVDHEDFRLLSILVCNSCELTVNLMMIIATFVAIFQIRKLHSVHADTHHIDGAVLFTAFGILLYRVFAIMAGCMSNSGAVGKLIIVHSFVELTQVFTQLLLMSDLKHKAIDSKRPHIKPGRQSVTFLVICNLAMWITYNFEAVKDDSTPDQVDFFGELSWVIIQRITLPLCILFRFKSAAIFAGFWKNCYRISPKNS